MPIEEESTSLPVRSERTTVPSGVLELNIKNLLAFIGQTFDLDELKTLCFTLGVDFDDLHGEGKVSKARELMRFLKNHKGRGGLQQLCDAIRKEREDEWRRVFGERPESSLLPTEEMHQPDLRENTEDIAPESKPGDLSENKSPAPVEDRMPAPELPKPQGHLSGSHEEAAPSNEGEIPPINTPSASPPAPSQSVVPNRWGRLTLALIGLDVVLAFYFFWYLFGYNAAVLAYVQAAASVLSLVITIFLAIVQLPSHSWEEIVNWLGAERWPRIGVIIISVVLVLYFIKTLIPSPVLPPPLSPEIMIPSGLFDMGSNDESPDASPQHQVYVETFWIDRYEVTNEKYKKFIDATGYPVPYLGNDTLSSSYDWDQIARTFPAGRAKHPVVLVSWKDARAYCQWARKRLPTEAEWEKAARGTDKRIYPWGDNWDFTLSNTLEGGRDETAPAGNYRGTSFYGVMDMAGNVWEWTTDSYQPYPGSNYWNGRFGERLRVLRGGSFRSSGKVGRMIYPEGDKSFSYGTVTTTYRLGAIPDDKSEEFGFRCVRSATEVVITPTPTETPTATYTPPAPTATPWVLTNTNTLSYADPNQLCSIIATKFPDPVRPDAIMISFDASAERGWCIWEVRLNGFNASKKKLLSFWVRGERGEELFKVGIKDSITASGDEPKMERTASKEWTQVFISLLDMQKEKQQNLAELDNFSLGFTHQLGSGVIYVQGFVFEP
jgi:formylglycine-generating enzyme required for sulfatase activity